MNKNAAVLALLALASLPCAGADSLKIGFVSTLSGPSAALGVDIRDGFNLAQRRKARRSAGGTRGR